jgi:serine/threonine-protein kinase HipA
MKNPKSVKSLVIYRGEFEAGILKRTEKGCQFDYNHDFLKNPQYSGLSYALKKSEAPIVIYGANLHPFFAGLLPEGLRLKALLSKVKTSEDDLFSLFAASGSKCIGDVYARIDLENQSLLTLPKLREIDFYNFFETLLKENAYAQGEDVISGVQEKISASMINLPLNIAKNYHAYILKLNPKDKPCLVENELFTMALAKKCGIDTAQVKFVKDKNDNRGLLVKRFDRVLNPTLKRMTMIHQEDACQFLNKYPSEKYRISLNEIAESLKDLATSSQLATLHLLRLYCFSYIIGNGDLHAKNISLYTLNDRVTLTPAYDLISTYIYGDHSMAMKVDGKNDNIKRKTIFDFARRFEIKEKAAKFMLDQLISDATQHHSLLFKIPMPDRKRLSLEKIIEKRLKDLS